MLDWAVSQKITLREKIRLLFRPLKVSQDVNVNCAVFTYYKEMGGKIYVIKSKRILYR